MKRQDDTPRVQTGVPNLDAVLEGGLPQGVVTILGGPPGSGKTLLAQQLCFHNASPKRPALYFSTLSEPTAKTLRHMGQFSFFDRQKLDDGSVRFIDVGVMLRQQGLEQCAALVMDHIKAHQPAIVVIDSFKVFDDLAHTAEELRKFAYSLAVQLMAWETTTLLLGEYGASDYQTNPIFSIVDGLIAMGQRRAAGEQQRFLQVLKMRGTDHDRDANAFRITRDGLSLFVPRLTIRRAVEALPSTSDGAPRCHTGIARLDELLGGGISRGSSLLLSGAAGTGKTAVALEFLYRGALAGEKGVIFSFEETEERLRAAAAGFGWDLEREIERGMVEVVFIPQTDIELEADLQLMHERVRDGGARRVAIDSVSVFLHQLAEPQAVREKVFQLATIVQSSGAVGLFVTDIPFGADRVSRFGVEETVVDGVILLSLQQEGLDRQRYLEVYKLRNTAHRGGRHPMSIGEGGVTIFPRYGDDLREPPPAILAGERLSTGVVGLDEALGGGLFRRSATVVSGSPGVGKSTLGLQFVLEGAQRGEPSLYVTIEEPPEQLKQTARALGLNVEGAATDGLVRFFFVSRGDFRAAQLPALLADELNESGARRLVIDGIASLEGYGLGLEELAPLVYDLTRRSKLLDITSMLLVEAPGLFALEPLTGHELSSTADNLLALRYAKRGGVLDRTLLVVKSRGSVHDLAEHRLLIGEGGVTVERPTSPPEP